MYTYLLGTIVLWAVSGALAVGLGLSLAAASLGRGRPGRVSGGALITLSRGLPTSLLVVSAGILATRVPEAQWLPNVFPGTPPGLQIVGWAVIAALALGSAGHLAVIFRTAYGTLGPQRIDQATALGLPWLARLRLLAREAAPPALPPTTARLVHHLHNTAFAALFPVLELFGWVQERVNATFDVTSYVLAGGAVYVALSGAIWAVGKLAESRLATPGGDGRRPIGAG